MSIYRINLACGNTYIKNWLNFDLVPLSNTVKRANLLNKIPTADSIAEVVYSSHFIEHIPRKLVNNFLEECYRITKKSGFIRLVLPDWEEMCGTYLSLRKMGKHKKADFLMLEMLDQCVRRKSGGEMGRYFDSLKSSPSENKEMIDYVYKRTGQDLLIQNNITKRNGFSSNVRDFRNLLSKVLKLYYHTVLKLLPSSFRKLNVSLTDIGEKHAWMYDFYTLEKLLISAGFKDVKRMSATTSNINDFPFYPLDITHDGTPRKGAQSMYIEAVKR